MVGDIIIPKLSIIFSALIRGGSFPECWWSTKVSAIPKGAPSHDRENYRPISITPILSKVNVLRFSLALLFLRKRCVFFCHSGCL